MACKAPCFSSVPGCSLPFRHTPIGDIGFAFSTATAAGLRPCSRSALEPDWLLSGTRNGAQADTAASVFAPARRTRKLLWNPAVTLGDHETHGRGLDGLCPLGKKKWEWPETKASGKREEGLSWKERGRGRVEHEGLVAESVTSGLFTLAGPLHLLSPSPGILCPRQRILLRSQPRPHPLTAAHSSHPHP